MSRPPPVAETGSAGDIVTGGEREEDAHVAVEAGGFGGGLKALPSLDRTKRRADR